MATRSNKRSSKSASSKNSKSNRRSASSSRSNSNKSKRVRSSQKQGIIASWFE